MGIQKGLLLTTHIWLHGCAKVEKEALPQIKQKKLVKQTNSDYIWTISLNILQCGSAYCSPPTPLFSNGNAKKPFCWRLVNHFMDVLKQKIIGLSCTDLVLVPILQGASRNSMAFFKCFFPTARAMGCCFNASCIATVDSTQRSFQVTQHPTSQQLQWWRLH